MQYNQENLKNEDIQDIWQAYHRQLKSFLHSKISNEADVEDCLQEIFIKVNNNRHHLHSVSNMRAWLYQIAKHALIDFYRKKGREKEIHADDLWFEQENTESDLADCIEPFIKALPKEVAEILTAIDIKGLSQKDYAMQNNINYSTLKSRLQSSRKQLRNLFEKCCYFSFDSYGNIIEYNPKSEKSKKC